MTLAPPPAMSPNERARARAIRNGWITAEEFQAMPEPIDGSKTELVEGKVITMPPVGSGHSDRQYGMSDALRAWNRRVGLGRVFQEVGFILSRDPDTVRGPDVAFIRYERIPPDHNEDNFIEAAPDLAVEVVSKHDRLTELEAKADEYLSRGTSLVWIVNRRRKTVTAYRVGVPPLTLGMADTLDGGDVLPGFAVGVAEVMG